MKPIKTKVTLAALVAEWKKRVTKKRVKAALMTGLLFAAEWINEIMCFSTWLTIAILWPRTKDLHNVPVALAFFWAGYATMTAHIARNRTLKLAQEVNGLLMQIGMWAGKAESRLEQLEKEPWQRE